MRAFVNYYLIINAVNLPVSFLLGAVYGKFWFSFSLCTFGLGIGLLAYYLYYRQQYYFYYNLGYTKTRLAAMVFGFNLIPALFTAAAATLL